MTNPVLAVIKAQQAIRKADSLNAPHLSFFLKFYVRQAKAGHPVDVDQIQEETAAVTARLAAIQTSNPND